MNDLQLPDLCLEVGRLLVELGPRPDGDLLALPEPGLGLLALLDQGQVLSLQLGEQLQQLLGILRQIIKRRPISFLLCQES